MLSGGALSCAAGSRRHPAASKARFAQRSQSEATSKFGRTLPAAASSQPTRLQERNQLFRTVGHDEVGAKINHLTPDSFGIGRRAFIR